VRQPLSKSKAVSKGKAPIDNHNGQRILISRLSHAVDEIEKRSQQNRPWKVVTVRRGLKEDPDAAQERHFAAHPEDRGADIVIFEFYEDEGRADRFVSRLAGPACEEP
jgi:hypothetical protein